MTGCHNITDTTLMRVAMAINKPLISQDTMSDSSGDEAGGVRMKVNECVCSKYENMKQKMKNCNPFDLWEEKVSNQSMNQKEKDDCVVDMDKDIDESMEMESGGLFDRKANYERTLDKNNPFRDNENERSCDNNKYGAGDGNYGNWFDKTLYGFYGDPRDFCREFCSAAKQGATNKWDNIEDCGTLGSPGGGCYYNHKTSVMRQVPYKNRSYELFIKDYESDHEGDIDKPSTCADEVYLEYLSLSGCYKITDKGLR